MNLLMESELDSAMWSALEQQYGLEGERLYRYLVLRSKVEEVRKGRRTRKENVPASLSLFLLNEWGLLERQTVRLHGEELVLECYGASGVHRIIADWHTRFAFLYTHGNFERDLEATWTACRKEAKRKVQKWSKTSFYEIALKKAYLTVLNADFGVSGDGDCQPIEGLETEREVFPVRLELQYDRLLHPYFHNHSEVALVDENSVEEHLITHLAELESGLQAVGRQIVLERGRIDILARDRNGASVVIEVKVESDTDLVWQQAYYTKKIEQMYGRPVRFIVVAPKWEPHIMELLQQKPNTEIKIFKPVVKQNQLHSLIFQEPGG